MTAVLLLLQSISMLQCQGDPADPVAQPGMGTAGGGATSALVGGTGGTETAGASGSTAAGGATAGSGNGGASGQVALGGTGGTAPDVSKRQACLAYAFASCRKSGACNGNPSVSCLSIDTCPDLVFSPGSTRTVEGLLACLPTIEDFDCEMWLAGFRPDCVTPGLRQPTEPCLYSSQCGSLICGEGPTAGCGQCLAPIGEGQSCVDQPRACDNGLQCSETNVCVPFVPGPPIPMEDPVGPLPTGLPCVITADCEADLVCVDPEDDGIGLCSARPGPDTSCYAIDGAYCQSGLYCDAMGVCRTLPPLGQPCGQDALANTGYCASGSFCNPTTDLCEARVPVGMPCEFLVQCEEGMCRSPSNTFAPCINDPAFPPELQTTFTDCICAVDRREGEDCDPAYSLCEDGTTCSTGVCTAPDSLGTFEAACGSGN